MDEASHSGANEIGTDALRAHVNHHSGRVSFASAYTARKVLTARAPLFSPSSPRSPRYTRHLGDSSREAGCAMGEVRMDPVGYCQMVAITWFVHDYVLTLADEIEYVWTRRITPMIGLFLVTRYLAFGMLVSSVWMYFMRGVDRKGCDIFNWISAVGTFLLVILVDIILQFRVYVMYGGNRKILYFNASLFVLAIAGAITFASLFFPVPISPPEDAEGSCYAWRSPKLSTVWITPLLFDIWLAILVVNKYCREWHVHSGRNADLLRIIAFDNVAYFLFMSTAAAAVFFVWLFVRVTPAAASVSLVHAAGAVGGSRLIINVRKAMDTPENQVVPLPLGVRVDLSDVSYPHAMFRLRELRSPRRATSTRHAVSASSEHIGMAH